MDINIYLYIYMHIKSMAKLNMFHKRPLFISNQYFNSQCVVAKIANK